MLSCSREKKIGMRRQNKKLRLRCKMLALRNTASRKSISLTEVHSRQTSAIDRQQIEKTRKQDAKQSICRAFYRLIIETCILKRQRLFDS